MSENKLIITAASKVFGPSVLALIGSIYANWPGHPDILVYDLGLDENTLDFLNKNHIRTKKVPEFCQHWRYHFTWKFWCWNDCPTDNFLWLDAGTCVLRPLDIIFEAIQKHNYFILPTYHDLIENASEKACEGCNVEPDFRIDKMTLAATIFGANKKTSMGSFIKEALSVSLVEDHIKATHPLHRHDQAIFSLLFYKMFGEPILSDGITYGGWTTPFQTPSQKIWVQRRTMVKEDLENLKNNIVTKELRNYIPQIPVKKKTPFNIILKQFFYQLIYPERSNKRIPNGKYD
ncbi:MAG: hypothetical protein JEZ06_08735 [Anaerolineaceae bacterium]|nr:hypothetical protein [Anaerolineaceae bacterium]